MNKKTRCSVPNCMRTDIVCRKTGYCMLHYRRSRKYGSPETVKRLYRHKNPICAVTGCHKQTLAKGLCQNHYALMKRNGQPVRKRIFKFSYIKDGYRYVYTSYRHYEPEHRVVIERFLKRKLKSNEHIHHIDGNTLNNSPTNLKIVTKSEHARIHGLGTAIRSRKG